MVAVLLVGSLQAWFLVLLLASKRGKQLPDYVLATWLALIGAHTGSLYLHQLWGVMPLVVIRLNAAFPYLQGPFLYVYVALLTAPRPRLRAAGLWHFLPFAAYLFSQLGATGVNGHSTTPLLSIRDGFGVWLLVSVPIYILASLILLRRYRRRLLETRSNVDRLQLRWLRVLVAGMGLVWLAVMLTVFFQSRSEEAGRWRQGSPPRLQTTHLVFPALTLFVYAIGYFGFRQKIFTGRVSDGAPEAEGQAEVAQSSDRIAAPPPAPEEPIVSESPRKYRKSGLGSDDAGLLHERLLRLMEHERPYLDPELTLGDLAGRLACPSNHISQVINELESESFYDFVNRYRVDAVAARLRDPSWAGSTVLDLAFDSGFGSKSTFNRAFRARTGQPPGRYRSRLGRSKVDGRSPSG